MLLNQRRHLSIKILTDKKSAIDYTSKPNFESFQIISDDIVIVKMKKVNVTFKAPVFVATAILELAKLKMYEFHYGYMMKKYSKDTCKLLFTDTDSLCYQIKTEDIYNDMSLNMKYFDTSNYNPSHFAYSEQNKGCLGFFKDETSGEPLLEFVGLKSKMYSLLIYKPEQDCITEKQTCKGIDRGFVKRQLLHKHYKSVLFNDQLNTVASFNSIRSSKHTIRTVEIKKKCLSFFDDKRYILPNSTDTLALGHWRNKCLQL